MKRVLVTGGAGFIGQYVCENLERRGLSPVVFDRHRRNDQAARETLLGDTRDFTAVNEAIALCDGVIHLAGVLGTAETINEPRPAVETNIGGGLNVFQACRNYQRTAVYIAVGNHWMNNSYSITKDTTERLAWMFNREHGTRIAVVRGLNAYGPRQKHEPIRKITPNLILPALRDEEIVVYGDGQQVMDMVYVADLADILVRALVEPHGQYLYNPSQHSESPRFEAGTGRATTVNDIAGLVVKLTGRGRIKHVPMRAGEPERSVVLGNPDTLRPLYGGSVPCLTDLETGLARTIEYYRSRA